MIKKIFLFLLISFTGICQAQPDNSPFHGKKLIGYVPFWGDVSTVDYANLSHAFFSYLKPAADGSLVPFTAKQQTAFTTFLTKTSQHSCQRFISLSDGGAETFPLMAAQPQARASFIRHTIAFCLQHGFQGIDLDWESMNNESRKKNYTLLLKEFRKALDTTKLALVATVYFGNRCRWIENEALAQADWINVMVYDQTGLQKDGAIGNHASFDHFLAAEQYWTNRGFPREKIVMGLPFYGYRFTPENGGKGKAVRYKDIANVFPNLSPADNQTPGKDNCFFNGPDLIEQKTRYALQKGFAGIMIWEMTQDNKAKTLHAAVLKGLIMRKQETQNTKQETLNTKQETQNTKQEKEQK